MTVVLNLWGRSQSWGRETHQVAAGETKLNKCIFLGKIKMLMLLHRLSIKSSLTWILLIVND